MLVRTFLWTIPALLVTRVPVVSSVSPVVPTPPVVPAAAVIPTPPVISVPPVTAVPEPRTTAGGNEKHANKKQELERSYQVLHVSPLLTSSPVGAGVPCEGKRQGAMGTRRQLVNAEQEGLPGM